MQTATNPETGKTVVLSDGRWLEADSVATNDAGERAYLIGGKWMSDNPAAVPLEAPGRTTGENLGRQVGRTARVAVTGGLSLPTMLAQGASGIINTVAGTKLDPAGALQRNLTRIGLPEAENSTERVVEDVIGAMTGAGGIGLVARASKPISSIGMTVKDALVKDIGTQITASGAAGGAGGITRESGGGPIAQLMASLGFGVGVPMGMQTLKNVIPNMVAKSIQKSEATPFAQEGERLARETGIDLSLGARSGNKQVLALENVARQYPPTADRVQNIDVRTANQAIERVKELANKISTNKANPDELGRQIEMTVKTAAQKIDTIRSKTADVDYGKVRDIAGNRPVIGLTNLQSELEKIISDYSQVVGPNADAKKIVSQAQAALNTIKGTLGNTVDEAMKTRSFYGKAAKGTGNVFSDLNSNIDRILAGRLFGAVNRDFEQAGATVGGPLKQALDVANRNYRNNSQSIEFLEKSAIGKLVGDDLVDSAMSGAAVSTTAGEEIVKRIAGLHPSTRSTSIEILNRWNPQLVKDLKASVLQDALDYGMSIPPSAKGASQVPLSFNRFLSALGSTKVSFEKHLKSYGFTPKEITDIRDTAVAVMRAGDKTGFNYSNTEVARQTIEIAGTIGHGVATGATWGPLAGMRAMANGVVSIASKRIGLNKVADAMESEAGRRALRTVVSNRASPQAVIAAFAEISDQE